MSPRFGVALLSALSALASLSAGLSSVAALLPAAPGAPLRGLEVVAEWRTVDFVYPNRVVRDSALLTGDFIPDNVVVIDVDAYGEGKHQRIFVTTPRLKPGVPATLSELSVEESSVAPRLRPFPSWAWNDAKAEDADCDNLISVFRTATDQCGRLWVLDSGTVDVFTGARRLCPPKLVVFDLRGRDGGEGAAVVARYAFPAQQRGHTTLTITVAVDVRGSDPASCRDAFAYVADVTEPAILVYDMRRNRSWRVLSNLLYPYPLHGSFSINGAEFDLMDGVFGMALGPMLHGDRRLFFHSLASVRESWVSTRVLRNRSNFGDEPIPAVSRLFHASEPRRSSQSAAEAVDANGVLFFSLLSENALACWNTRLPYQPHNLHIVAKDDKTMQFASGLKVIGRHVWMLSSRFQNVMVGRVRPEEVNYRVLVAPVGELTRGTPCYVPDNLVDVDGGGPTGVPLSLYRPSSGYYSSTFGSGVGGGPSSSISFGSTPPYMSAAPGGGSAAGGGFGFSHITPHPRPGSGPGGSSGSSSQPPSSYHQQHYGDSAPGSSGPSASAPSGSGSSGSGPGFSGSDAIVFREPVDRF